MRTKEEIMEETVDFIEDQSMEKEGINPILLSSTLEVLIDIRDILQGDEIAKYMKDRELITLEAHNSIVERLKQQG